MLLRELIDHDGDTDEDTAAGFDELPCRSRLTAALDPVVDEQETLTGTHRLPLDLQALSHTAIVGIALDLVLHAGEQRTAFADGDEAHPERDRGGAAEEETTLPRRHRPW